MSQKKSHSTSGGRGGYKISPNFVQKSQIISALAKRKDKSHFFSEKG